MPTVLRAGQRVRVGFLRMFFHCRIAVGAGQDAQRGRGGRAVKLKVFEKSEWSDSHQRLVSATSFQWSWAAPSDGLERLLPGGERERGRWGWGDRRGGAGLESGLTAGHSHVINVEVESSWTICLDRPDSAAHRSQPVTYIFPHTR